MRAWRNKVKTELLGRGEKGEMGDREAVPYFKKKKNGGKSNISGRTE